MNKPLGIVIATRWEAGTLLSRFGFLKVDKNLYQTDVDGRRIYLCISGVGPELAREAAMRLCQRGAGELISAGFCGALVPNLQIGDLVMDRLASSPLPVRTREERAALSQRANAVAVDMETQAVIEAGTRRGVPIRILRVVSDRVDDDLTALFGAAGKFRAWEIALRLLNPGVWPLAARLRRHSAIAKARLAESLASYLNSSATA